MIQDQIQEILTNMNEMFRRAVGPRDRAEYMRTLGVTDPNWHFSLTATDIINKRIPGNVAGCTGVVKVFCKLAADAGIKCRAVCTVRKSDWDAARDGKGTHLNGHQVVAVEVNGRLRMFQPTKPVLEFIDADVVPGNTVKFDGRDDLYLITAVMEPGEFAKIDNYKKLRNIYASGDINNTNFILDKPQKAQQQNVSDLYDRASKHFNQYLDDFLNRGETTGLPMERLMPTEWTELNKMLAPRGVALVRKTHKNGQDYMFFDKLSNVFQNAINTVKQRTFDLIKSRYPNLPDANIEKIVTMQNPMVIYDVLRHKQGAPYTSPSSDEHEMAIHYANQTTLETNSGYVGRGRKYQTWTEVREFHDNSRYYKTEPLRYHISLNVNVTRDLLYALDRVLARDAKHVIGYYKFPAKGYHDECVTRFDPVTIYAYRRDPVVEKMIADAVAPYVRSNEGLLGEMVGRGVCVMPEILDGEMSVGEKVAYELVDLIQKNKGRNA